MFKKDQIMKSCFNVSYSHDHTEIRDAVTDYALILWKYWQACDADRAYPTDFVQALTDAGYLSALIPEEYGGLSLPISAGSAFWKKYIGLATILACHAQMYTMGTVLRHGSDSPKKYLPAIADGGLRLQAFGVTEPTSGTDTTALLTLLSLTAMNTW